MYTRVLITNKANNLELGTKALLQKVLSCKALSSHTFCTVLAGSQQCRFCLSSANSLDMSLSVADCLELLLWICLAGRSSSLITEEAALESQNSWCSKGPLEIVWFNHPPWSRVIWSRLPPVRFWVFLRIKTTADLCNLFQCSSTLTGERSFLCLNWILICAHFLLSCHWASLVSLALLYCLLSYLCTLITQAP